MGSFDLDLSLHCIISGNRCHWPSPNFDFLLPFLDEHIRRWQRQIFANPSPLPLKAEFSFICPLCIDWKQWRCPPGRMKWYHLFPTDAWKGQPLDDRSSPNSRHGWNFYDIQAPGISFKSNASNNLITHVTFRNRLLCCHENKTSISELWTIK